MQSLVQNKRTSEPEFAKPDYGFHDAGVLRAWPRPMRKLIRFCLNFSFSKLNKRGTIRTLGISAAVVLLGGAAYYEEANTRSVVASASDFAGLQATKLVVNGNVYLEAKDVGSEFANQLGGSMFYFDVTKAREQLLENPWVEQATIRKVYPDTIVVDVMEKTPLALWKLEEAVNLISANGTIISRANQSHAVLPQVVGDGANQAAPEFLQMMAHYPDLASRSKAYVRVGERRWNLVMRDGARVLLPEQGWQQALQRLEDMQKTHSILDRELLQLDMRLPDRMAIKLDPASAEARRTQLEKVIKGKSRRS